MKTDTKDQYKLGKNEYMRRWRQNHPEKTREKSYQSRAKNDAKGDRNCTKCKHFRLKIMFGKGSYTCRYCNSFYHATRRDKKYNQITCSLVYWINLLNNSICAYCHSSMVVGADRIDNTKGHEEGNLVPACADCNYIRGDVVTYEEMVMFLAPAIRLMKRHRLTKGTNQCLNSM